MPVQEETNLYTYQDYLSWPDEERCELIGGRVYSMTPAPNTKHQRIALRLGSYLERAFRDKPCEPWMAPTDVILSDCDIVQPDLFVICNPEKVKDRGIEGAPDLVIEILSPATARKDRWEKKKLYEKAGVKEYILIDPDGAYAERYLLDQDGLFDKGEMFDKQETINLRSINEIDIPLVVIFGIEKQNG